MIIEAPDQIARKATAPKNPDMCTIAVKGAHGLFLRAIAEEHFGGNLTSMITTIVPAYAIAQGWAKAKVQPTK